MTQQEEKKRVDRQSSQEILCTIAAPRVGGGSRTLRVEFDPRKLDDSLSKVAETHGLLYARRSAAEGTAS